MVLGGFAGLGLRIFGIDEEVIFGACEGDVEHVYTIYRSIEMLFFVRPAIGGLRHLFFVVYWHEVFSVMQFRRDRTPDFLRRLAVVFLPIAERHKERLRLQALTLMDSHDLYGAYGGSGDGFRAERLFPVIQEIGDVTAVRTDIFAGAVQQAIDVRRLAILVPTLLVRQQQANQFAHRLVEGCTEGYLLADEV